MSEEHVAAVFGPKWVRDELDFYREQRRSAERIILRLRAMLCANDSSLPHPLDGQAWAEIEDIPTDGHNSA